MKLIDKDALVAEIERLITPENGYSMNKLIESINTLEVKEVDSNDDFIEKAQSFFRQSHYLFRLDSMDLYNFVEDFRNYMKGH